MTPRRTRRYFGLVLALLGLASPLAAQDTLLSTPAAFQAPCASFFQGEALKSFLTVLEQMDSLPPLWTDYRPNQQYNVLTGYVLTGMPLSGMPQFPHCAVIVRGHRRIAELELTTPFVGREGLFAVISGKRTRGQSANALIQAALAAQQIPSAVLWNIYIFRGDTSIKFPGLSPMAMIHETFHFNSFMNIGNRNMLPQWVHNMPNRDELPALCYTNALVDTLFTKEGQALEKALRFQFSDKQPESARTAAQEFIRLRQQRYALLKDVRVPSSSTPEGISCAQAEAMMELIEGVPQYVGMGTLFVSGYMSINNVIKDINPWYYRLGLWQLLFVRALQGTAGMEKTTFRIARSPSWEQGIFYEFQQAVTPAK